MKPESSWSVDLVDLLGKRVEVTYSREPLVTAIGELRGFGEGGDACLADDGGFLYWVWPLLEIRELT